MYTLLVSYAKNNPVDITTGYFAVNKALMVSVSENPLQLLHTTFVKESTIIYLHLPFYFRCLEQYDIF